MFMIAVVQLRLVRIGTCSWPMRKIFRRVQKHSIRVMGCRVCQLNLCHNNVLIGDLKSLRIKLLRKAENSKKKKKKSVNFCLHFCGIAKIEIMLNLCWLFESLFLSWNSFMLVFSKNIDKIIGWTNNFFLKEDFFFVFKLCKNESLLWEIYFILIFFS